MKRELNSHEVKVLLKKIAVHRVNGDTDKAAKIIDRIRREASPQAKLSLAIQLASLS